MPPATLRSDDPWNLRPYDVPWGEDYFDYKPGKLPGHDGDCLVLRSPTPVEQKRTAVACKHCRQRKAKCSGDRPACSRCADRGRRCIYPDPEERQSQPVTRTQRPARTPFTQSVSSHAPSGSRRSSVKDTSSSSASSDGYYDARLRVKPDPDGQVSSYLYNAHGEHAQVWRADSPDSGYSSPPMTYSEHGEYAATHYNYPGYPPDSTEAPMPSSAQMSPAIYSPTPVRLATTAAESYAPRSSISHVAAAPTGYGYQDLAALHAPEPTTHNEVFADSAAAAAAPHLDVTITENTGIAVAPSFAYHAHSHAYPNPQEPVGVAHADHAQCLPQYHHSQDYVPAAWFNEQDVYRYVVARQSYPAYVDPVSYTHPVY